MLAMVLSTSLCFFFSSRRRHTRSLRDWSSDVCSSDLLRRPGDGRVRLRPRGAVPGPQAGREDRRGAGRVAQLRADQGQPDQQLFRHAQARDPDQVHEVKITERRAAPTEALVVLPTYNEKENLERVVSAVRHLGHDVLIVDDASPDRTGELADTLAEADSGVRVMHRERKLGIGSAYEDAFRIGLAEGTQLFVQMDADGSHQAQDLGAIVNAARGCGGLAIGSRYVRGGRIVGWPAHRLLLSSGANIYTRSLLGLRVRDCTSGFRCYT